jgi:hypothetical protein
VDVATVDVVVHVGRLIVVRAVRRGPSSTAAPAELGPDDVGADQPVGLLDGLVERL